jgi:hypothetical protein
MRPFVLACFFGALIGTIGCGGASHSVKEGAKFTLKKGAFDPVNLKDFHFKFIEGDYFPVKEGSTWEYDVELQINSMPVQKGTITKKAEGEEKINGKTYLKIVDVVTIDPEIIYVRNDSKDTYSFSKKHPEVGEQTYLPSRLMLGHEWTRVTDLGQAPCRLEDEEDIQIGDQVYKRCLKVKENWTYIFSGTTDYYAPDIGLVKRIHQVRTISGAFGSTTLSLKKYSR